VKEQPGVEPGQQTYCLVSGVVITAGAELKPARDAGPHKVWFCCEACAQFFDANRERILAARRIRLG
jgi:hypothetical protein